MRHYVIQNCGVGRIESANNFTTKLIDDFVHALDALPVEAIKNRLRFGRKAIHTTRTLLTVPQTASTRIMA